MITVFPAVWANRILTPPVLAEALFVEEYTEFGWLATTGLASLPDGYYVSFRNGSDAHLARVNYFGNIVEQTIWDFPTTVAQSIQVETDGTNLFMTGTRSTSIAFIAKLTSTSNMLWLREVPNISPESISFIGKALITSDDGAILPVSYVKSSPTEYYPTLIKFDATGNTVWESRWVHSGSGMPYPKKVVEDSLGNLYTAYVNGKIIDVIKLNSSGTVQWIKSFDADSSQSFSLNFCTLSIDGSDNLYVSASSTGRNFLAKISSSGSIIWYRRFDPNFTNYNSTAAESVETDAAGNTYLTFWALKVNNQRTKFWLKFDTDGNYDIAREISTGNILVFTHTNYINGGIKYGKLHFAGILDNYGTDYITNLPIDGSVIGETFGTFPISYRPLDPTFALNFTTPTTPTIVDKTISSPVGVHVPTTGTATIVTVDPVLINLVKHVELEEPFAFNITTSTSNATVNTRDIPIYLTVGQTLRFGTTDLAGASFVGDTFIRLLDPSLTEVANNDDYGAGVGSYIEYTATVTGVYTMRIGCFGTSVCSGNVAWDII